jgi:hypothetical protein
MAATKIADVIIPQIWVPYVIERTAQLSAIFSSGVISRVSTDIGKDLKAGGKTVNMPFWADLSGTSEVLSDSSPLTVNNITGSTDVSVVNFRGKAWGANELASQLAGSNAMDAIAELVAAWWARDLQATLLSVLSGAMSSTSMANNVWDISAEDGEDAVISASSFVDACQVLGDSKSKVTAVMMHSAVESALAKQDLIEFIQPSTGAARISTFMGKRVIVDDSLAPAAGVYTTYIFGDGAIGYDEGGVLTAVETDRDSLSGVDLLINRKAFVMHPRGIKWAGTPTGAAPTNAELGTATNWTRVYENKNIRIVKFKHTIVPNEIET